MHYFYVLFSLKDRRLYKGSTTNVAKRFIRHNEGGNKSTAYRKPFVLIHVEIFDTKKEALLRERFLKSIEGSKELNELIDPLLKQLKS